MHWNRSAVTTGAVGGGRECGSKVSPTRLSRAAPSESASQRRNSGSGTERTILHEMGQEAAANTQIIDSALDLAERIASGAESGRVDLADLGRRARRLLESTARPLDDEKLF